MTSHDSHHPVKTRVASVFGSCHDYWNIITGNVIPTTYISICQRMEQTYTNDDVDDFEDERKPSATTVTDTSHAIQQPMVDEDMEVDATSRDDSVGSVYVAVDGLRSRLIVVDVKKDEPVHSISKKIKEEAKNSFASYDAHELSLFKSEETTELEAESQFDNSEIPLNPVGKPLGALEKWNPRLTWGTETQPLIVKAPTTNNSGECFICCVVYFVFHIFINRIQHHTHYSPKIRINPWNIYTSSCNSGSKPPTQKITLGQPRDS